MTGVKITGKGKKLTENNLGWVNFKISFLNILFPHKKKSISFGSHVDTRRVKGGKPIRQLGEVALQKLLTFGRPKLLLP